MIYIALGANLPNGNDSPAESLRRAAHILSENPNLLITAASRIWCSPAWPNPSDPKFYNGMIQVETHIKPLELLYLLQYTEQCFGRVRTVKNAPRVLDLDLISYGDEVVEGRDLILPHPRMQERSFVLYPLKDIAPDFIHPVSGLSLDTMIKSLSEEQIIDVFHDTLLS